MYGQGALSVGVYGETLGLVVAFEPAVIDGLDLAACTALDFVLDNVCPNCLIQMPAGGAYLAQVEDRNIYVAYVTFHGPEEAQAMCNDLPLCTRAELQPLVLDLTSTEVAVESE